MTCNRSLPGQFHAYLGEISIDEQEGFSIELTQKGGDMELNRNQFFMAGLLILMLGIQLRSVETFVLNEKTTQFLAQRMQDTKLASANNFTNNFAAAVPVAKKRIEPPRWIGWSMISIGTVLVLHSLALKKPG